MRLATTIALVLAAVVLVAGACEARALAAGASQAQAPAAVGMSRGPSPAPAPTARGPGVVRAQVSVGGLICKGAGWVNRIAGAVCKVASHPKTVITVGKKLLTGHPGGAVKAVLGTGGKAAGAALGLAAVVTWVTGGARAALQTTAKLVDESARPNLESTWFSSTYWRVAAVSALLTLPFLFAAAIQALLRSDMTLLARAAFGYLPLGMLAVGVAAPITMLLLAASDEMSAIVASASGDAGGTFLGHVSILVAASNPFVAFFVALLTVAGAITLWLELLVREAAVYVIVLMLPLFFAALVWPARRIWAARAVELLIALILSKFAIVAVLQLGGAALQHAAALSITSLLAGLTLVLLAAFSPWALLRLLPLHELASAAATGMRHVPLQGLSAAHQGGLALADAAVDVVGALPSRLQEMSQGARDGTAPDRAALPPSPSDGASELASEERVEAGAEEAAAAVAGSGGGSAGGPASPPAAAPTTTPEGGAPPPGDGHLSAPWLRGMRAIWHSDWRDQEYPRDAGIGTPVAEVGEPAAAPVPRPDTEPPTVPDAPTLPHASTDAPTLPGPEPHPPTAPPEEDTP